jgi:transposase
MVRFKGTEGLIDIVIGFESSGPYGEPLVEFLRAKPVRMVQVNPLHTKRVKELTGNSPNKTDRKDPRVIADVICLGHSLSLVIPQGPAAQLRRLTQAREGAIKSRSAMINRLGQLVFVLFPEFGTVMKSLNSTSALCLLKRCASPGRMVEMGLGSLTTLLKEASRGRLAQKRAERLLGAAQISVGIKQGTQGLVLEIEHLVSMIEQQNRFIGFVGEQMAVYLGQIDYSWTILSIRGIGRVIAGGLIGEIGDFGQFQTIGQVTKLAGLDLYEISSGRHRGRRRISKRGRPLLRKLLFFGAINVIRTGGIMHGQYRGMVNRGMPKLKALVAISRKLLALIFALVRDRSIYRSDYVETTHQRLAA